MVKIEPTADETFGVGPEWPPEARAWLDSALAALRAPLDRGAFHSAFAGAARRVGPPVASADATLADASNTGAGRPPTLDHIARGALLRRAIECLADAEQPGFVDEVYRRGDGREQTALLRTLVLLPGPERFLATAVEACRSNVADVFEAVACANAYPAQYFPDTSFNQMVMKALFLEVPLVTIVRLAERITPELQRMVRDYVAERRAAGRRIPTDVALILPEKGTT